jgi:hypothetical protein
MEPSAPRAPKPEVRATLLFLLVIAAALVLLILQARHFFPFIADDAFISMRYSQRLLEGKGLTWSSNQRVEGYSNLLWVLLCAGLGKLGMDLLHAARLLGILPTLLAFASIVAYIRINFTPERRPFAAVCSLIPFALSSPIAVWMIGGLEQALLIGLLGWAFVAVTYYIKTDKLSSLGWASLLLAAVTLTRADGLIFPLLIAFALLITQSLRRNDRVPHPSRFRLMRWVGSSIAPASLVLIGPVIAYAAQLAFRLSYYHDWLPNTAYVKVSFSLHRLVTGTHYLAKGTFSEFALMALAIIGCIQLWRTAQGRALAILYLIGGLGTIAYLVLIGGDIFPAVRHFVPIILIMCFAAAHASLCAYNSRGALLTSRAAALACLALLVLASRIQARKADTERWEWKNRELGLYIRQHFKPNALLVADAAGATPFYSHLDAIDPLGLNDYHIAHQASLRKGSGLIGHELGDGKYVLDHDPDIIILGVSGDSFPDPDVPSDYMIMGDPRFKQNYELQHWSFTQPVPWTSDVYVRRSSIPKISAPGR